VLAKSAEEGPAGQAMGTRLADRVISPIVESLSSPRLAGACGWGRGGGGRLQRIDRYDAAMLLGAANGWAIDLVAPRRSSRDFRSGVKPSEAGLKGGRLLRSFSNKAPWAFGPARGRHYICMTRADARVLGSRRRREIERPEGGGGLLADFAFARNCLEFRQ